MEKDSSQPDLSTRATTASNIFLYTSTPKLKMSIFLRLRKISVDFGFHGTQPHTSTARVLFFSHSSTL